MIQALREFMAGKLREWADRVDPLPVGSIMVKVDHNRATLRARSSGGVMEFEKGAGSDLGDILSYIDGALNLVLMQDGGATVPGKKVAFKSTVQLEVWTAPDDQPVLPYTIYGLSEEMLGTFFECLPDEVEETDPDPSDPDDGNVITFRGKKK